MYAKSTTAAIAAMLLSAANAHFFISSPAPIPGSAPKDPLDASGANFPCHGADLSQGTVTQLQAGQSYPLQFDLGGGANTAVHGGGSCQLSVAYSTDETKLKDPSNWKVITSFVGGCPTNAPGNLPTAVMCPAQAPNCVNALNFTVPQEVQNGNAIFAWTWFNNIGNREMYMNCAKVSLSGGQNQLSGLPNMFVANLASVNQCKTTETKNLAFPDPGKNVQQANPLNYPLMAPQNCGTSSGSSGAAGAAAPAAGSSSSAGSAGVFAPGASSAASTTMATSASAAAPATAATSTPAAPASPPAAPASPPAAAPATGAATGGSSGSCSNGAVACTASGFYCVDATHYGECSFGCAVPMAMAAGTQCQNGAVVAAAKRSLPRNLRHFHRRHVGDSF